MKSDGPAPHQPAVRGGNKFRDPEGAAHAFASLENTEILFQKTAGSKLLNLYRAAYLSKKHNDLTGKVEDLGIPFKDIYPDGESVYARNVWDLKLFAGKIFIGAGNSSNFGPASNAGPVRIRLYDVQSGRFLDEGSVDDEQIDVYRVFNIQLYIPGHDPMQSWNLGNFYRRNTDGTWNKYRDIPAALHSYDMALFGGKLYAALGTDSARGAIM